MRIDDMLPMGWRRLDEQEFTKIAEYYEKNRVFPSKSSGVNEILSAMDITDKLRKMEREDPTLALILSRLDMKLNLLIKLFHPAEEEQALTLTQVNLSGGGMAFWEKAPAIEIGDILELRLALSEEAMATIDCYARVMNIIPGERDGMTRVALKFDPILGSDRERIIQHIFKRQSEQLRAKRGR
ncbi:putative type IV pilus assembly PilZ [Magnetofaba australis IT-1]|uniref:Putative type IV pilus assembly PilZ n=1 Tax=Magnetofaba australis IT-1 TaxID=1434232 RepID=A0A1Y2K3E3_9PROT|nr:putative type IV pilus assembly PilZ [Magnetofaba australis IT-1]